MSPYRKIVERLETERRALETSRNEVLILVVNEMLKLLGWDVTDGTQVRRNVEVPREGPLKDHADCVLYGPGGKEAWAVMEVRLKGYPLQDPRVMEITYDEMQQRCEGIRAPMYIITDGSYWEVGDVQRGKEREDWPMARVRLETHRTVPPALEELIGYESVCVTGAAIAAKGLEKEEHARHAKVLDELPEVWRELREGLDERLVERLADAAEERGLTVSHDEVARVISQDVVNERQRIEGIKEGKPSIQDRDARKPEGPEAAWERAGKLRPLRGGKKLEERYRQRWLRFGQWQEKCGRWWKASERDLKDWVEHRLEEGETPRSIREDLRAVSYVLEALGHGPRALRGSPADGRLVEDEAKKGKPTGAEIERMICGGYRNVRRDTWHEYWRNAELLKAYVNGQKVQRQGWGALVEACWEAGRGGEPPARGAPEKEKRAYILRNAHVRYMGENPADAIAAVEQSVRQEEDGGVVAVSIELKRRDWESPQELHMLRGKEEYELRAMA